MYVTNFTNLIIKIFHSAVPKQKNAHSIAFCCPKDHLTSLSKIKIFGRKKNLAFIARYVNYCILFLVSFFNIHSSLKILLMYLIPWSQSNVVMVTPPSLGPSATHRSATIRLAHTLTPALPPTIIPRLLMARHSSNASNSWTLCMRRG